MYDKGVFKCLVQIELSMPAQDLMGFAIAIQDTHYSIWIPTKNSPKKKWTPKSVAKAVSTINANDKG